MDKVLWEYILQYGGLAVLTILFFLFARGYIVSRATLQQAMDAHKATVERIVADNESQRVAYESSIKQITTTFENTIDKMCKNFNVILSGAKEIVAEANHPKKKKV